MKSIFEQNGGTYTKVGDYYIPNISVPDTNKYNIGKYGSLRRTFLKEHHKSYYTILFMEGKLFEHLAEIDETCHNCLKDIVSKMAEHTEGVILKDFIWKLRKSQKNSAFQRNGKITSISTTT